MKKQLLLAGLFLLYTSVFAKTNQVEPEWFRNHRDVYPSKTYLAQKGSGKSEKEAKTDALAAISRYVHTSVNANLSTSYISISNGNSFTEEQRVVDERNVSSQVELFGVEYSESYYYKPEKKWYVVAYIYREDAWTQYKPQIESAKTIFYGFYDKAKKEDESFIKCGLYANAWEKGKDFLEKLEYGRILFPEEEEKYAADRSVLSEVPSLIASEIKKSSIIINISGDYSDIFLTTVSNVFSDFGFTVGKNGKYKADVVVSSNQVGSEPMAIYPGLIITITGNSNKSVFSYNYKTEEKTIAYTLENAQKKAFPKAAEEIKVSLRESLEKSLTGN